MMPRLINRRSKKFGLPPGSLIHVGEKKSEKVKISIIDYDEEEFMEKEVKRVEECFSDKDKSTITWIDIVGIHHIEIIEKIGKHFDLHPLILEDIMNTEQRSKIEDYEDYIFIVLKIPYYDETANIMEEEQISLILSQNRVITFQENERELFDPVRERLRSKKFRIRKQGADYLAYSLIDIIVDSYFVIMDNFVLKMEDIEEELIANPTQETLHSIHYLKKEITLINKSAWPLRNLVSSLERGESPLINKTTEVYFRDVYDHTIRIVENIATFREMISGMLDIYLSNTSNKMNEIMMFLTIIGTIFIPLTFITGIYGMNFRYMPELKWIWGYPGILFIMLIIGASLLIYFRRKKWL